MMRSRRSGVEDLWTKTIRDEHGNLETVPSKRDGVGKRWRARYVDDDGDEHSKAFHRKVDAKRWLDSQTASLVDGTHVAPRDAQITVAQWCDRWITTYCHRESTVREAKTHISQIVTEFGCTPLSAVRPSQVKAWRNRLNSDGYKPSYVYALHARLSQIMADAVHDRVLGRSPCSKKTVPAMGKPEDVLHHHRPCLAAPRLHARPSQGGCPVWCVLRTARRRSRRLAGR